jgi:hypothetical protein
MAAERVAPFELESCQVYGQPQVEQLVELFLKGAERDTLDPNARIEHDRALARVMTAILKDDTQLFKQFSDNEGFKRWLADTVFGMTYPPLA